MKLLESYIIMVLLISCEKKVNINIEDQIPKMVINGILNNSDTLTVQVSESRDIFFEDNLPLISNATVIIFDSFHNTFDTLTNLADGYYQISTVNFKPEINYTLLAYANGFESVHASTHLPKPINNFVVDTIRIVDKMRYEVSFFDDLGEENFYIFRIKQNPFFSYGSFQINEDICTNQLNLENENSTFSNENCSSYFLFKDTHFNGTTFVFSAEHLINYIADSTEVILSLSSISKEYFKYKVTSDAYNEVQPDPFSQPVQVYTNIENGFGIFAGESIISDTLILK